MVIAALFVEIGGAQAFDDAACSRIVTSQQHHSFELRPGETADVVRARALDEVSKFAVFEVIGGDVESTRADETNVDNSAETSRSRDTGTAPDDGERDRNAVTRRFKDVARSSYKGLVRIKLISDSRSGPPGHESLDVVADVTVCQPKADTLMALEREKAARDHTPPQVVDPDKVSWFDPATGEPQLWYWLGPSDTYTFFDKGGYDPMTGDPLRRVDRQFSRDWKSLMAKRRKDAQDFTAQQQREAALRQQQADAARQQAESRAAQDARRIQGCDAGAANPNDPRKPATLPGVAWDALKSGVAGTIQDCEAAVRLQPGEARLRYQLARAYSVDDPKRALLMLKRLCDEHYPAAYDNYGWALLDRRVGRNDLTGAMRAFETGIAAGDSDAMTSLAGLIVRDSVVPNSPDEALQLYRRAAKLGNGDAAAAVTRLEADQAQADAARARQTEEARQQAIQQQQAAQMFIGVMGGALRNVGRR